MRLIVRVSLLLLAMALPAAAQYQPLTADQAVAWDLTLLLGHKPSAAELADFTSRYPGAQDLARETITLDWIQHVTPTAAVPPLVVALTGRDLTWAWQGPLVVTVPAVPGSSAPAILYNLALVDGKQKDFTPSGAPVDLLIGAAAFFGGLLLGKLLH